MTWYAIHTAAGELVSVGTTVADPLPDGLTALAVGDDKPSGAWNAETLSFDPVAGAPEPLTKLAFLRRIPAEKRIAIRAAAKADPILEDAMGLLDLAEDVSVTDPDTVQLVGYLQAQGFLTADEASGVLA